MNSKEQKIQKSSERITVHSSRFTTRFAAFLASGLFLSHPIYRMTEGRTRLWRGCGWVGTVEAMLVCWFAAGPQGFNFFEKLFFLAAATLISIPVASLAGDFYGHEDDSRIVIDEFVGFSWAGLWFVGHPGFFVAAVFLFRILDVAKPWGIRRLEALPRGLGCVMDDVASGIVAAIILVGIRFVCQIAGLAA